MTPRSYLYVPGDQPKLLARAAERGADALIFDLEDAVAQQHKDMARTTVSGILATEQAWVRVNSDTLSLDIAAVADLPGLAGVVVPKAEPELLSEVDRLLSARPDVPVLAMLETAKGLRQLDAVACSPRVVRLGIGEADLAGELGIRPGPDREELWPIRTDVVVASAAASLRPPVGPVDTSVRDVTRLEETTRRLLRQGFRARTAITPHQLAVINEVFTPTEQEVAEAREVLGRLAAAGSGLAVAADGQLLDRAVVRSAWEILDRAR